MSERDFTTIVADQAVRSVLARLHNADRDCDQSEESWTDFDTDPFAHPTNGFSLFPAQGDFLYLLVRYARPTVVVEFATSLGFSALYLASAVKENGVGHVYGSEVVSAKADTARRNLEAAGVADHATILGGDARTTLRQVPGPIDLCLIDGWPTADDSSPSAALQVLHSLEDRFRPGSLVINDNEEPDYLEYVRDQTNGYGTLQLPWKGATEASVRL